MFNNRFFLLLISVTTVIFLQSCSTTKTTSEKKNTKPVVAGSSQGKISYTPRNSNIPPRTINTKNITADSVVQFAETLIGTKYKYGSANKEVGFDCSGFITYVFAHFNIQVPRSSVQFTNTGTTIDPEDSRKGDLILFTGTDTTGWIVGHMGIITQNNKGKIKFIHSASGNNKGVMESEMSNYFITRFVKVIRIFNRD